MEYKNKFHILSTLLTKQARDKKLFLFSLVLLVLGSAAFAQTNSSSVAWNTSFSAAQTLAQSVNRPLFLFFEDTPTNAITLSLLQHTFTNPEVVRIVNERFVPLRIKNNPQLVSTFNVIRHPTIIITDPTGQKIINNLSGIMSTEHVLDLLNTNVNTTANAPVRSAQIETVIQSQLPVQQQQQLQQQQQQLLQQPQFADIERTTSIPSQEIAYHYNGGSFVQIDGELWLHKTPFYTVNYKIFSDSKFFYYLESEDKETFVAVPKSQNNSLWIWESNVWRRISREE